MEAQDTLAITGDTEEVNKKGGKINGKDMRGYASLPDCFYCVL
jgi:hypothetical protein